MAVATLTIVNISIVRLFFHVEFFTEINCMCDCCHKYKRENQT